MLTALDRHFGWSGGESIAAIAILLSLVWFAANNAPEAQACAAELSRHVTIIIR